MELGLFILHSKLFHDVLRGFVLELGDGNDAFKAFFTKAIVHPGSGCFGPDPEIPIRLDHAVADLDLVSAIERLQSGRPDHFAGCVPDHRTHAESVSLVAVDVKADTCCQCLFILSRGTAEIFVHLGIRTLFYQLRQVIEHKRTESQPLSFQNDRGIGFCGTFCHKFSLCGVNKAKEPKRSGRITGGSRTRLSQSFEAKHKMFFDQQSSRSTTRREFLSALGAAGTLAFFTGCRGEIFAQNEDTPLLDKLRANAIRDSGVSWCGARDVPDTVGPRINLASEAIKGERIEINGTVFRADGTTPAENTLIYIYHTDTEGIYGRDREHHHGRFRAWLLTGKDGRYGFETIRPASYPNSKIAAHIHMTVTTVSAKEDWIDSILFEGDTYITQRERESRKGGFEPIVKLVKGENGLLRAVRDIRLA
jgi:hypothetical protein